MVEFKQIIGRGTRVRDDYGKLYFTILDYTGSATRLFADPAFDGEPVLIIQATIDDAGAVVAETDETDAPDAIAERRDVPYAGADDRGPFGGVPRKYYFDGGQVEI